MTAGEVPEIVEVHRFDGMMEGLNATMGMLARVEAEGTHMIVASLTEIVPENE